MIETKLFDLVAFIRNSGESHLDGNAAITKLKYKNLKLVVNKNERKIGRHIYVTGKWQDHYIEKILNLIKTGDTVVEVGTNYGVHSFQILDILGSSGKLYQYEYDLNVYQNLLHSYILNITNNDELYYITYHDNLCSNIHELDVNCFNETKLVNHVLNIPNINLFKVNFNNINTLKFIKTILYNFPETIVALNWEMTSLDDNNRELNDFINFLFNGEFKILRVEHDGLMFNVKKHELFYNESQQLIIFASDNTIATNKISSYIRDCRCCDI